jgi:hypothetical protein
MKVQIWLLFAILLAGGFRLAQTQPQAKPKQRGSDPILQLI